MQLSAKTLKKQLALAKPIVSSISLKTLRRGQNMLGELMESRHRENVIVRKHNFDDFDSAWVIPKDERRYGVILYLHGGGYVCGGLEYSLGFGSMLADECGIRVFCAAYRLAPEHRFPAAVDDALTSYKYLLEKGFAPSQIILCGESAGGGLCYSLCEKIRSEDLDMPAGIIAVSPWTDLTSSGESYAQNIDRDPTMTVEQLRFFADSYIGDKGDKDKDTDKSDPMVSPIFADTKGFPPSLIFVGGDEIMKSDSEIMHRKLLDDGCRSRLVVTPERWHGYLLYGLNEDRKDFDTISKFLDRISVREKKLRWLRLDNAAKIYPAARRENWSNLFRLSVTLKEDVDKTVLASALDVTVRRFPSIAVRLRRGVFWYYLQELSEAPRIREEEACPLTRMSREETGKCAFRVIVYKKRIAVEVFHALTDGTGALIFLKSLTAEYLQQKHGIKIPLENGILGRLEHPSEEELEDSFQKYSGPLTASRKENDAFKIYGTPEPGGFLDLTCLKIPSEELLKKAHEYGVSVTTFITAVMMTAIAEIQKERVPVRSKRKPVKVLIPVNLRNLYKSSTLRNFALYTTPEILPVLGDYEFSEICDVINSKMKTEITPKQMSMKIATNVNSERFLAVRIMPLFIKNFVMKAVFDSVGEKKSCLSLSNLGVVKLPEIMNDYVDRFDFILGVQATSPYNCGVISYKDTVYINFIRNIKESDLEYHFFRVLRDMGIPVTAESNSR